ncbi:hypothetical protein KUTeg_017361 [Tegillarca granosa]|uniref:Uncharacterized protein n=1 Tax=Tegillarca granosa TaxID=220873 RepID=A0ABQ9EPA6_TEGGR|nr:hypothetical protein KUTeg_017361 [Tegillarca granosa]
MFSYLKEILATFPSHQFRATWQNLQLKHLQQNLPQNNCMCVHDFSENYNCFEKDEIQSNYFQKNEVSLHVSVIYRHSILEVDGVGSSDEHPNIITEHLFLVSPDLNHDHNFSQYAQLQVAEYLRSINYECSVMHEFTDGCPCQYKSRHCMGGISVDKSTLGYDKRHVFKQNLVKENN